MALQEESEKGSYQVDGRVNRVCAPCRRKNKNTIADFYCTDCIQYQCAKYSNVHERFNFMFGHDIVKAILGPQTTPDVDLKGLDICDRHKKQLEFFCVDHQTLCCSSCAIVEHRRCKEVNEISTHAPKADLQPDSIKQGLSEMQRTASKIQKFIQESTGVAEETSQLEPVLSLIDDIKKSLTEKCDDLKKNISHRVRQSQSTRKDEIMGNVAINATLLLKADEDDQILASVLQHGTPEQKFIALHSIEKHVAAYKTSLRNQKDSLYKLKYWIKYSQVLSDLLQSDEELASVVVKKVKSGPEIPAVEIPRQLKLVKSVDLKRGVDNTRESLYTGMDFLPDGRLAVIDNMNRKLKIHDESLQVVHVFKFSGYRHGVYVMAEDEVAVTSGGGYIIEFLHVSMTSVITLTRTVKTTARYDSICMMNETTFLVSTFGDKRSVRMITVRGKENDFDNLPEKEYRIDNCRSTYICGKDKLVLTDRTAHVLYLYDNSNNLKRYVVTDERIKEPTGVCVGPDDCLYVCSSGTNSVVQVSSSGRVIASHKLGMVCPFSVCISKDGNTLAVSNGMPGVRKLQTWKIL